MFLSRYLNPYLIPMMGLVVFAACSGGSSGGSNIPSGTCTRFDAGSVVQNPPVLTSVNGVLTVNLSYNTGTDSEGRTLYCFTTPSGQESPTLMINPGDTLIVNVKNNLPQPTAASSMQMSTTPASEVCGSATMTSASVNIHYHGTNTAPTCHSDEVIHTLINPGELFTYTVLFPSNEPPGLYWYHPHVHGLSENAVLGGATGAIIVEGLEAIQPAVLGLPQQVLVIRDQNVAPQYANDPNAPFHDLTLNYIPISYPQYTPSVIVMQPGEQQLWRVLNSSADTTVDLQLQYDGVPQTLQVVGLDGVHGIQDGTTQGTIIPMTDIIVPPASRVEFIMTGPSTSVQNATFYTLNFNAGFGNDPQRPLATIQVSPSAGPTQTAMRMPRVARTPWPQRFAGLAQASVNTYRRLYFSEDVTVNPPAFYITVDGATPTLFSPNNPPSIVTTQGSVEDWTIENRSEEVHTFHIHQIHFLMLAINGVPVTTDQAQMRDTFNVPAWSGTGPYPSITVRMDFRGDVIGDFVYHCHILGHEDLGMMAIIRVMPATTSKRELERLRQAVRERYTHPAGFIANPSTRGSLQASASRRILVQ